MSQEFRPHRSDAIPIVPATIHASIGHLPQSALDGDQSGLAFLSKMIPAGDIPFWQPGILSSCKLLRWRWAIMIPSLALTVSPAAFWLIPSVSAAIFLNALFYKIWITALCVVLSLMIWAYKNAVRKRTGIFCIHCGYDLTGSAPSGNCSECGRPYIPGICDEYRCDPTFFRRRLAALRDIPNDVAIGTNVEDTPAGPSPIPASGSRNFPR